MLNKLYKNLIHDITSYLAYTKAGKYHIKDVYFYSYPRSIYNSKKIYINKLYIYEGRGTIIENTIYNKQIKITYTYYHSFYYK